MTARRLRQNSAPALLDPGFALIEGLDRWRRRIRPLAPGSLLGVQAGRHRGCDLTLADGTTVREGASLLRLHLDNRRLRELATEGWQTRAYAAAAEDLATLAARVIGMPGEERPVALTGVTLLAALTRRVGFELRDRPQTPWTGLEDWYLRTLLRRWAPGGAARLARGHGPLRAREAWMSADELLRRYGPPPR